jgi:hypothetical protein
MKSQDEVDAFFVGAAVTLLVVTVLNFLPWTYRSMAADALENCQKSLPRDQTCVVVAVPKEKK